MNEEETKDLLERIRKKMDADDEAAKKAEDRRVAHEELKKDKNYDIFKNGGIEEMIAKDPEILDNKTALKFAIEAAVKNVEMAQIKKESEDKAKTEETKETTTPSNPASSNNGGDGEKIDAKEFIAKMNSGTATMEDYKKVEGNINPFIGNMTKRVLKYGFRVSSENIEKARATFGVTD